MRASLLRPLVALAALVLVGLASAAYAQPTRPPLQPPGVLIPEATLERAAARRDQLRLYRALPLDLEWGLPP